MRSASITRKTGETDISLTLNLDGKGESSLSTGCGFLDHMLTLFAKHGRFDLTVTCKADDFLPDKRFLFFLAFVRRANLTVHIQQLAGKNSHHIIEGTFKSLARSLRQAVAIDPAYAGEIPSTKGVL